MPGDDSMSLWGLLYRLIKEKGLRAIVVLVGGLLLTVLFAMAAGFWIVSYFWQGGVEIEPSSGSIKLLQANREYRMLLVHPFGWQSTDVDFQAGQTAQISAGGKVTVGYIEDLWEGLNNRAGERCVEIDGKYGRFLKDCLVGAKGDEPEPRWPWVGPEGYKPEMYRDPKYNGAAYSGASQKMLVDGIPHGALVGIIRPRGQPLSPSQSVPAADVYELGRVPSITAKEPGVLWVTVNDSGPYLHDNLGYFSLTISTQTRK